MEGVPDALVDATDADLRECGYVRLDGVDVEALRKGLACVVWSPGGGYATHVPEIIVETAETILALAEGETP